MCVIDCLGMGLVGMIRFEVWLPDVWNGHGRIAVHQVQIFLQDMIWLGDWTKHIRSLSMSVHKATMQHSTGHRYVCSCSLGLVLVIPMYVRWSVVGEGCRS
jgi:hypothetical protein